MTDAEINLAIAKIEYPNNELYPCEEHVDIRLGGGDYITVDYCNNWEDIGPIIERESINLFHDENWEDIGPNEWSASGIRENGKDTGAEAETPTKAAALCYLKMKGVE